MKTKKNSPVAAVCSALGTALLVLLVLLCLPLTVPRVLGFHIYTVVSGSMEPAILTGSLVYVQETEPADIERGEVAAFYGAADASSIITHRVTENRKLTGELITKGDANAREDMNPVPYQNLIGKVVLSVPVAGFIAQAFTGFYGKLLAAMGIVAAVLLHIAAAAIEKHRKQKSSGENYQNM